MSTEPHWEVVSPEMVTSGYSNLYDEGPPEYGCDVASVAAPTKREAIRRGTKLLKKWVAEARGEGFNPFAGVTAERPLCPHGVCFCQLPECADHECAVCEEETDEH